MPYSQPFVKVNFEGHFGSSASNVVENWTAGLHITKNGGVIGGTSELTSFLTAIRSLASSYHGSGTTAAGTNCFLDAVSGAYIGTDGKYALGALQNTTRVALTASQAGGGAGTGPWSQSFVFTFRSLLTRGPASHGRMYWPATALAVVPSTGVVAGGTITSILALAKTFLDGVNVQAALAWGSGTNIGLVSPQGSGFQSPVTRVGFGQRMDSMESRERNISEAHVFSNLSVSALLLAQLDDEFRDAMKDAFPDADED